MRYRWWLVLAILVGSSTLTVPVGAQDDNPYANVDQEQMLEDMAEGFAEPPRMRPSQWLDVGLSLPVSTFNSRDWTPGFIVQWNQDFLIRDDFSIFGSLGAAWNNDTRYNESQTDSLVSGAPSVMSRKHLGIPASIQLQFEPFGKKHSAPFISAGPAIQWNRERVTTQEYKSPIPQPREPNSRFRLPDPGEDGLVTTSNVQKTKFNPGYAVYAGFRTRVGEGTHPLHMRIRAGWNVWYERAHPISMISATLSFGR